MKSPITTFFEFIFSLTCFEQLTGNFSLSVPSPSWSGGGGGTYNPFDSTSYEQKEQVTLDFTTGNNGSYFISFSRGSNISSGYNRLMANGSNTLSYQLYAQSGQSKVLKEPTCNLNETLSESIKNQDSGPIIRDFYWYMPASQVVEPGTYTDTVDVSLYSGSPKNNYSLVVGPYQMSLSATVPAVLFLSLVDSGSGFDENDTSQTIDFGVLEENETSTMDILVLGNAGYSLTMESLNGSKLVGDQIQYSELPYTVSVGGSWVDISSGSAVVVDSYNSATLSSGNTHSVLFKIGSLSGAFPQGHSDQITVSVSAN